MNIIPQHTVTIEPVTGEVRLHAPVGARYAVVERFEGRLVKVCTTTTSRDAGTLEVSARSFASVYGATYMGVTRPADVAEDTALWQEMRADDPDLAVWVLASIESRVSA